MLKKGIYAAVAVGLVVVGGAYFKNAQTAKQNRQDAEQQRLQEAQDAARQRAETESAAERKREQARLEAEQKQRLAQQAAESLERRKLTAEQQAKHAVKVMLRDPGSAEFRSMAVVLDAPLTMIQSGAPRGVTADFVCGEINAKNAFGGYAGYRWFYWDSNSRKVFANTVGRDGEHLEAAARATCLKIRGL